jgi:hypothetical protein
MQYFHYIPRLWRETHYLHEITHSAMQGQAARMSHLPRARQDGQSWESKWGRWVGGGGKVWVGLGVAQVAQAQGGMTRTKSRHSAAVVQ